MHGLPLFDCTTVLICFVHFCLALTEACAYGPLELEVQAVCVHHMHLVCGRILVTQAYLCV